MSNGSHVTRAIDSEKASNETIEQAKLHDCVGGSVRVGEGIRHGRAAGDSHQWDRVVRGWVRSRKDGRDGFVNWTESRPWG